MAMFPMKKAAHSSYFVDSTPALSPLDYEFLCPDPNLATIVQLFHTYICTVVFTILAKIRQITKSDLSEVLDVTIYRHHSM